MLLPTQAVLTVTEAVFRAQLARYVKDVDAMQAVLVADTNWIVFPDIHLWQSVPGTFNPTTATVTPHANHKDTNRRNDSIS